MLTVQNDLFLKKYLTYVNVFKTHTTTKISILKYLDVMKKMLILIKYKPGLIFFIDCYVINNTILSYKIYLPSAYMILIR